MSDEITTESKAVPAPSHGEMFFRYVAALAQTAGIQAFTMAVAVPKEDGTSAIMAVGVGAAGTSKEWQEETSKLLGENAAKAALNIIAQPVQPEVAEVV